MENTIQQVVSEKELIDSRYIALSQAIEKSFNKQNIKNAHLFTTDVDETELMAAFIGSFPEDQRQCNSCSCCLRFIKQYGRLVFIVADSEGKPALRSAIWAEVDKVEPYFHAALTAMKQMVEKANVTGVWFNRFEILGNYELGGYNHLQIKRALVPKFARTKTPGQAKAEAKEDFRLLSETVNTLNVDIHNKTLTFFKNDGQLRGRKDHIADLEWLGDLKKVLTTTTNPKHRQLILWLETATQYKNRTRIGQNVLGAFMYGIEKGLSFDMAKKRYLEMTNGLTYQRAQEAPTQGNVQRTEKIFEALGLASSLKRRFATLSEIALKVWVPKEDRAGEEQEEKSPSLFGHLKTKETKAVAAAQLPTTIDGGTLSWVRFMDEVLTQADNLFVRINRSEMDFSSLSTCIDPEAQVLLAWDSPEDRNQFCAYRYHNGSTPHQWGLSVGQLVSVKAIIPEPQDWKKPGAATGKDVTLMLVLEGASDLHLPQIPLFGSVIANDLHEVRSTLENFFKQGKMEPQPEDMPAFGALSLHNVPGYTVGYEIHVVTNGVKTKYFVDRYN